MMDLPDAPWIKDAEATGGIHEEAEPEVEEKVYSTLKMEIDYLDDPDTMIHLGAVDGSGFWFVGTREEFYKVYRRINMKLNDDMLNSKMKAYRDYIKTMERLTDMIKCPQKPKDKGKRSKLWHEAQSRYDTYWKKKGYIDSKPKPIDERKVKEMYPRIQGGIVILVEGIEPGLYWDREEYENDV